MTKLSAKAHPHVSLRLILVVPFVLQIFAVVGLVGYLSFKNSQKSIDDLANRLVDKTDRLVEKYLDDFLATPQQINAIASDAAKAGILDLNDFDRAGHFFWNQAQLFDVSWAGYALPSGVMVGAGDFIGGKGTTIAELSERTNRQLYNYRTDSDGNRLEVVHTTDYDPLSYDWYLQAIQEGKASWSSIRVESEFQDYITVTAVRPVYDSEKQLIGVFAVDHLLSDITHFLQQLNISPSGEVFIMERNGQLVASSSTEKINIVTNGQLERIDASDSRDRLIQATAQHLQQHFSDLHAIQENQAFQFDLEGSRQFVGVVPWQDEFGLDWLLVSVIPESDFSSQIRENTRLTILLCLLAFAGATSLGIVTSKWMAKPISDISDASASLAKAARDRFIIGDNYQSISGGGIKELDTLAISFNQLADQLRLSFTELETLNDELEERVEIRTTELKQALSELRQTQLQMIQSEKMSALGQMVAGVAHEINNPINFIYGNLEFVEEYVREVLDLLLLYQHEHVATSASLQQKINEVDIEYLADDLPKLMKSMRVGAERINEIVKSLRIFSRLDEAELKALNIHEGIDSTLMILDNRLKKKLDRPAIDVTKMYGDLPDVECYPGQLNQVFMNILSNAIDALEDAMTHQPSNSWNRGQSASARSLFHIRIQTEMTPDQQIIIRIADNGPGMSSEIAQRIFDPFFTTKAVGKGTGMGLSISYEIIAQKHGGQLRCISDLDQGTEFVIEIPMTQKQLIRS